MGALPSWSIQQAVDAQGGNRGRPEKALAVGTAEFSGERDLLRPLDPFEGDFQPQFGGCRGQCPDEHVVHPGPQGFGEGLVELDPVHGQAKQISQARPPAAEVVQPEGKTERSGQLDPGATEAECTGRAVSVISSCTVDGETPDAWPGRRCRLPNRR